MRKHFVKLYGENFVEHLCKTVTESEASLLYALQLYKCQVFNQETVVSAPCVNSKVRLVGSGPTLIPARSIRILEGSVQPSDTIYTALVERVEAHVVEPPSGETVGAAVVNVTLRSHRNLVSS